MLAGADVKVPSRNLRAGSTEARERGNKVAEGATMELARAAVIESWLSIQ